MVKILKKIFSIIACFALVFPIGFLLTACGHNHEFKSTYETNATHHWRICTVEEDCDKTEEYEEHSFGSWTVRTAVTCTQDGLEYRTCKCGYEETREIPAHGHAGGQLSNDETHHWRDCINEGCDYDLDKAEHTWGDWKVVNPATCTSQGARSRSCTKCNHSESENISMIDHVASSKIAYDETHHWNVCKNTLCNEKVNKTEHNVVDGICSECHYGAVASIGETYFTSFADAIDSIEDKSVLTTIVLFDDVAAKAVKVASGYNIIFDLNGHTYTITQPAVGSTGTTTSGFQLLKGSNITFKNGTITHATSYTETADACDVQILIQNYAKITLKGETNIIADQERSEGYGGVAFDLWYSNSYSNGVTVEFDSTFTGVVSGKIEYGAHSTTTDTNWESKTALIISGGVFTADQFVFTDNVDEANIVITGGLFNMDVSNYVADGYICQSNGLGNYIVMQAPSNE